MVRVLECSRISLYIMCNDNKVSKSKSKAFLSVANDPPRGSFLKQGGCLPVFSVLNIGPESEIRLPEVAMQRSVAIGSEFAE